MDRKENSDIAIEKKRDKEERLEFKEWKDSAK